jgi:predicted amidophosphoribosyltransferase
MSICKKCIDNGVLENIKDVSIKICLNCKKQFRSRFLNVCPTCQYNNKNICLFCGTVVKNNK